MKYDLSNDKFLNGLCAMVLQLNVIDGFDEAYKFAQQAMQVGLLDNEPDNVLQLEASRKMRERFVMIQQTLLEGMDEETTDQVNQFLEKVLSK